MKESELAKHFIDYFKPAYDIYQEVPAGGGIVDIVATDGHIVIGCEVKTSFGLTVMEQAYKRRQNFHYTYICVPYSKVNWNFRQSIIRRYGIGLLVYSEDYRYKVREDVDAKINRHAFTPDLKKYMKESVAGSQSERVTAFGNTVNKIRRYLKLHGDSHINDVLENIEYHYDTMSTAESSIKKWINRGIIVGITWDKAILKLEED